MQLGEPRFSAVAVNVAGAGFETPKKVMVLKFFWSAGNATRRRFQLDLFGPDGVCGRRPCAG